MKCVRLGIAYSLIVLACGASVALAALPTGPAGPPAAAGPAPCKPAKRVFCGPLSVTPAAALKAQQKAMLSDKLRKRTSLPSLTKLFGRSGKKAQQRAYSKAGKAVATAAAARGTAMKPVGKVGGVKVEQGSDVETSVSDDSITTGIEQQDELTRGRNSQSHSMSIAVQTKKCPVAGASASNNAGLVGGKIRAQQSWRATEVSKGEKLVTQLTLELDSEDIDGTVLADASYSSAKPSERDMNLILKRTRTVTNLKTKKTSREKPLKLQYSVRMVDQWWMQSRSFDRFIDRQSDNDAADAVRSDSLLNEAGFEAIAERFGVLVSAQVAQAYGKAAAHWQTPNKCATMTDDLPGLMRPDESKPVNVTVSAGGRAPAALLSSNGWLTPYRTNGFSITPFATQHPGGDATKQYTLKAPSEAWPDGTEEVVIRYQSAYGVAETRKVINAMKTGAMVYSVTMVGSGNFSEHSESPSTTCSDPDSGCAVRDTTAQFNFDTRWPYLAIPTDGGPAVAGTGTAMATSAEIGGGYTENSQHTGNGSTLSCPSGIIGPSENPASDGQASVSGGNVTIRPLKGLAQSTSSPNCSNTGDWWGDTFKGNWTYAGTFGGGGFGPLMTTVISPTPDELAAPSFSKSVAVTPAIPSCQTAFMDCTQTLSWNATVTFTKTMACGLTPARELTACVFQP